MIDTSSANSVSDPPLVPTGLTPIQTSLFTWGPVVISVIVLGAFGLMLYLVLTRVIPTEQKDIAMILIGGLNAMAGAVVYYWVGSSSGSAQKAGTIAQIATKTPAQ